MWVVETLAMLAYGRTGIILIGTPAKGSGALLAKARRQFR